MNATRKLAAVLVADIVGFSRLTGLDEDDTLARVRAFNAEVVNPSLDTHRGRLVKRTGDGFLAEFRSVVDAVRCALDIQTAMPERNADIPAERHIDLRMGLHVGDVLEETDGDLMGDGVNVAARLEGLADPGGICLSEDAYRQVRARLDLEFADLGESFLKNIAHPVRVYSVRAATGPARSNDEPRTPVRAGVIDKASIAVLPFTNMSGDVEQEYFVDGMVEDIITALSKFDELFVVARNSTFVYKGRAVDVKTVGKDLGVRYVLEGSARKAGERVRITGQLIDTLTGAHLWADKYDGELTDIFELQDQVATSVVAALEPTLRKAEIARSLRKPVEHWHAYDLLLQSLPYIYAITEPQNHKALGLLERAIALDPGYGPALAHGGWALVQRITRRWPDYGDNDLAQAVDWARMALEVGRDDAKTVVLGGFVLITLRQDYATGIDAVTRAAAMNSGSGFVNGIAGAALVFADEIETGLHLNDRAMVLCPNDPSAFSHLLISAAGHLLSGKLEKAVELALRSLALKADVDSAYWILIAAYDQLGRTEQAQAAAERLLAINPRATASGYESTLPIRNAEKRQMVFQALGRAGLPR